MRVRTGLSFLLLAAAVGCGGSDSPPGGVRPVSILAVDEEGEAVRLWSANLFRAADMEPLVRRNSIGSGFGKPGTVEVPDEPVHLTVSARGYHSVEKTVADPWRAGEEWRIPRLVGNM